MAGNPVLSRQPELIAMWQDILRKAQPTGDPPLGDTAMINLIFDGAGQALTVGMGGIAMIPYPCRLLGCSLFGGITSTSGVSPALATATVYIGIATGAWSTGARPMYGTTQPAISSIEEVTLDTSDWVKEFQPYDLIAYSLTSFSGTASLLTVSLLVRKIDVQGIGVLNLTSGTDNLVSGSNRVVFRS